MEKNITKRKTTVNITIYGSGLNARNVTEELENFGNPVVSYEFRTVGIERAINENDATADLFIILNATDNADTASVKNLAGKLAANNQPTLMINTNPDNFTALAKSAFSELDKALAMGFTSEDFACIHDKGITIETVARHLSIFRQGIAKTTLRKPATPGDGIFELTEEKAREYAVSFDAAKDSLKLTKFVPASGAATRMFKFLNEFINEFNPDRETINAYVNRKKDANLRVFLVGLDKFPFYREVMDFAKLNEDFMSWTKDKKTFYFIKTMLSSTKFNFANKPKGILPFHQYGNFIATPIFEHLKESAAYTNSRGEANIQFTISEEHLDEFLDNINSVKPLIEKEWNTTINFSFSYQLKNTDTIAVDLSNEPFRDSDGKLLFRPGGHGALIENLGKIDADIVFIKNIDNVSHNNIDLIAFYKKALAGILIEQQQRIFTCLREIDFPETSSEQIDAILAFAQQQLLLYVPTDVSKYTLENKKEFAKVLLNKPIRVCGMVKNEGEPGGGPFWTEHKQSGYSLQIVESSQIDLDNKAQKEIFAQASHFNPVDLVCGLKNYKGEFFNLQDFVDKNSGFIVHKNRFGKEVKSYELPGLWNGAMSGWITIFAEVPLETFNPVKTVNDLLKPAHQPQVI